MTLDETVQIRDAVKAAYLQALVARASGAGDINVTRQSITDLRKELDSWERAVVQAQRESIESGAYPTAAIARWYR